MKKSELRAVVEEVVREQLYEMLPGLLKEVISEVVGGTSPAPRSRPNSILEELELEDDDDIVPERPAVRSKSSLSELMDQPAATRRSESIPGSRSRSASATITLPTVVGGPVHEIKGNQIPDYIAKAMTRNYSDLLKATKDR